MGYFKTQEAIFKHLPELTKEDEQRVDSSFSKYFFFKDDNRAGVRECWCGYCKEHFYYAQHRRIETPEHYEFLRAKHNGQIKCPACGAVMQAKETYRAKECKKLEEWRRMVIVKPKSRNEVFLICGYAHKDYSGCDYLAKPEIGVATVYYLAPGVAREFKNAYDYTYLGLRDGAFHATKRITEPFTKTWWSNISSIEKRGYHFIGFERLQETFLRYVPVNDFAEPYRRWYYGSNAGYYVQHNVGEVPEVKLLCYAALYPSVEKLIKLSLGDFVCNLLSNRPMKRCINWSADTPKAMFGMNKADFADFRAHYTGQVDFEVYQTLRRTKGFTYTAALELVGKFGDTGATRLAKAVKRYGLNLTHTQNYLDKQTPKKRGKRRNTSDFENTAELWTDYLHFASELKYDLSRPDSDIVFPKDLQTAHDTASALVTALMDRKNFEKYQARYERLQKLYEYTDGQYQVVIPLGVEDVIAEGNALGNCVGGYAERHMEGKTTILFLRRADEVKKRLVTIEIRDSDKRIGQIHGRKNRNPTKDEQVFIEGWLAWVKAGSKRKKKKSAEKAE